MKKLVLFLIVAANTTSSCMKDATFTCKSASGNVLFTSSTKLTSNTNIVKFKIDCKAKKTKIKVNGVVVSSTPCEVI